MILKASNNSHRWLWGEKHHQLRTHASLLFEQHCCALNFTYKGRINLQNKQR